MSKVIGKVQIIGPVVDVVFNGKDVELQNLWFIRNHKKRWYFINFEVQSHIGEDTVRTISMDSTDGLSRGMK
jgi:F-type H+-transporting ATPase subunit beta